MKLNILCEKCGKDNYKSLIIPITFKYHSESITPIFECNECHTKYAMIPKQWYGRIKTAIYYVLIVILNAVLFYQFDISFSATIGGIVAGSLCTHGAIMMIKSYFWCYLGLKPMSFDFFPIDENFNITYANHNVDYTMFVSQTTNRIKKIKEGFVYKCIVASKFSAVKLQTFNITDTGLELILKNVSIHEKVFDGSEIILLDIKGHEICRGEIYKLNDNSSHP